MSAPALPDAFGNYALGDFVEVVSPAAISWLPQTAGWWWLGAVLLGLGLRTLWRHLRHWYRNRYRREAVQRLQALPGQDPAAQILEINKLLKLTAMAGYSRDAVASLSGQQWVDFLNRECAEPVFCGAQCEALALGVYGGGPVDSDAANSLMAASLNWVREHQGLHND